jgi:hypothetical protein
MIKSASEFIRLRDENDPRATHEEAPEDVWMEVLRIHPDYREWVALNKTVPLPVLKLLAADSDARIRFIVAMKRKCDHDLFQLLANDQDETVRSRVAYNPNTPKDVLQQLKADSSALVREAFNSRTY